VTDWFGDGNTMDILNDLTNRDYEARLKTIDGLDDLIEQFQERLSKPEKVFMMEFALHGLAEHSLVGKKAMDTGQSFKDLLGSMFNPDGGFGEEEEDEDEDDRY